MSLYGKYLESIKLTYPLLEKIISEIREVGDIIVNCYMNDGKVFIFGNGGSAAQANHFYAEMIGKISNIREPLPTISLSSDPCVITAIANDFGFEYIFSRQLEEKILKKNDVVIGISTSGRSLNVINGIKKANDLEAITIGLTGDNGGELSKIVKHCLMVYSNNTQIIQDVHGHILHLIALKVDEEYKNGNYKI